MKGSFFKLIKTNVHFLKLPGQQRSESFQKMVVVVGVGLCVVSHFGFELGSPSPVLPNYWMLHFLLKMIEKGTDMHSSYISKNKKTVLFLNMLLKKVS